MVREMFIKLKLQGNMVREMFIKLKLQGSVVREMFIKLLTSRQYGKRNVYQTPNFKAIW